MKKSLFFVFITLFIFTNVEASLFKTPPTPPSCDSDSFQECLGLLRKEASRKGIRNKTLRAVFPKIKLEESVIELDKKQPEKTRTIHEYFDIALSEARVAQGQRLYKKHYRLLRKISREYGVQPRFIVALWGLETSYGNNTGGFTLVDSLATLAYDGRRRTFFTKELINALQIIDDGHIKYRNMKGSWAGAMGQCQFMPSSFISYAVDYNGDGKKDIWHTKADIFASIANYLSKKGWDNKATWGRKVILPKGFNNKLIGTDIEKNIANWNKLGVRRVDGKSLPKRDLMASIVIPDEDYPQEVYMVYNNYKVLLKWNRSLYFATGIGRLSHEIKYGR